ncbi:MAG: hypothetical protein AAF645_23665 [Myxococcota bacterium]
MGFELTNSEGEQFRVSGGHWAIYLNVAEAFGWRPAGTLPPDGHAGPWSGRYDSNDGQRVSPADAKALAETLNGAARHPQFGFALQDQIGRLERSVEADGLTIPDGMRMKPNDFVHEVSPLLMFLYGLEPKAPDTGFTIR